METQSGATRRDEERMESQAGATGFGAWMAELRAVRREVEREIVPLAHSIDGRHFTYQHSPVGKLPPLGGFVTLRLEDGTAWFGQVITREVRETEAGELAGRVSGDARSVPPASAERDERPAAATPAGRDDALAIAAKLIVRGVGGEGLIFGRVVEGRFIPGCGDEGFNYAELGEATATEVDAYYAVVRDLMAPLDVGVARFAAVPVDLDAKGFNRHSFLCGQSGSGKTFSLGVILERLLLETDLRLVVIDPNSDFVRLGELLDREATNRTRALPLDETAYEGVAARYRAAAAGVRVLRPASVGEGVELRLRFGDLDPHLQALILRLDPLLDRDEYGVFHDAVELGARSSSFDEVYREMGADERPEVRDLALRIKNLGIDEWEIWRPSKDPSLIESLKGEDWRCLVVDIGRLSLPAEKSAVAAAVLSELWRGRDRREPILVVIDEAHNVCPALPEDSLTAAATGLGVLIAGEGRKFGLYLLVASQRPSKIHPNVLSQCENLILMRMNSRGDLAHLTETFSHVPASLMAEATQFTQGESLAAGRIVPAPTLLKFGGRLSAEGGGDVPTTWARRRRPSGTEAGA